MLYADAHCDSIAPLYHPRQLDAERLGSVCGEGIQFMAAFSPDFSGVLSMLDDMDTFEAAVSAYAADWRIVRAVEGGDCLRGDMSRLDTLYERGVRSLGLTWNNKNELSGGANTPDIGLTAFGAEVIERCEELGILVDLAHISLKGFFDALKVCKKPPIVSHTAAYALHSHKRSLTDGQIRAVAERGGVIGVCLYPDFLGGDDIDDVVRHIEHIRKVGGRACTGIGTDFDGIERLPKGISGVQDMPKLLERLDEQTIGLNFARIVGEIGCAILLNQSFPTE
ncbi:MAG: dipeptidase [Oscillospiraceae bacterium]|nr:dipeptidase [Oscillospiraceae bacterium]